LCATIGTEASSIKKGKFVKFALILLLALVQLTAAAQEFKTCTYSRGGPHPDPGFPRTHETINKIPLSDFYSVLLKERDSSWGVFADSSAKRYSRICALRTGLNVQVRAKITSDFTLVHNVVPGFCIDVRATAIDVSANCDGIDAGSCASREYTQLSDCTSPPGQAIRLLPTYYSHAIVAFNESPGNPWPVGTNHDGIPALQDGGAYASVTNNRSTLLVSSEVENLTICTQDYQTRGRDTITVLTGSDPKGTDLTPAFVFDRNWAGGCRPFSAKYFATQGNLFNTPTSGVKYLRTGTPPTK
jgi:hypothetical protein